jgi:hypothetical protein
MTVRGTWPVIAGAGLYFFYAALFVVVSLGDAKTSTALAGFSTGWLGMAAFLLPMAIGLWGVYRIQREARRHGDA